MPQSIRQYLSERGFPLLYIGEPLSVPVITLENYTKWYSIYRIEPDGTVNKIPPEVIDEVMARHEDAFYVDHNPHPRLLFRLSVMLGADLDERAEEVATGRWIQEVLDPRALVLIAQFHSEDDYAPLLSS